MAVPAVSFVVPCYNLAHLLAECVESILAQTYDNLEVLIMDDCSPDGTPDVARSFGDPRVRHVRNDPNLGHLRNYNKGISLARGRYIWLVSADDCLRRPYILQQYVELLDSQPRVGFTCCPGVRLINQQEGAVLPYSVYAKHDQVVPGRQFLTSLVRSNTVLAASALARRECYDRVGVYPENMPWVGDWYMWCMFCLHFDVGYFAEAMVCYREHDLSMTQALTTAKLDACAAEEIAVPWLVRKAADLLGKSHEDRTAGFLAGAAATYARTMVSPRYDSSSYAMNLERFEASLCGMTTSNAERDWIRARVYESVGSEHLWRGQRRLARQFYRQAAEFDPRLARVQAKKLVLALGAPGERLWKFAKKLQPV